jgi:hypothetical protein
MQSLLEILREMGKRPLIYIGEPPNHCSIWHLHSFIVGFQLGRYDNFGDDDLILGEFDFWICTRYRIHHSANWAGLLWLQSRNDAEAAFRLFFELLNDYLKDREQLGPAVLKSRFMQVMAELPN